MSIFRKVFVGLVSSIVIFGGATLGASAANAASWSGGCTASRMTYDTPGNYFQIATNVSATLNGVVNTSTVTLTTINYFMGYATITGIFPAYDTMTWWGGTGSSNNINIAAGSITRNSPDSLGWSGTWNFTDFTVPRNSTVQVQFIPDFSGTPDPNCTTTFTVG